MIYELNHVGAHARDAEKSIDFYVSNFGGKIVREAFISSSKTKVIYLQVAGGMIELLCPEDPGSRSKYGFDHVAFMTDDLDGDFEKLTAAGFEFSVPPKVAGSGDGRLAFLSDPNGVRIELIQRDDTHRVPKLTNGKVKGFDHISLVANSLLPAETFYTEYMNLKPLKRMRIEDRDLTMVYLMNGEDTIELLHKTKSQIEGELIGHIAFRVDNADEMTSELQAKGVVFEPGSPKTAGTGLGRVSVFRGPDGEKIELVDRDDLRAI